MKKLSFSLVVGMFLYSASLFSQQPPAGRQGMADMPMDGKIIGKLIDASTNQPVEYASVAVYKVRDSSLVTGVVSDPTGNFVLDKIPYGKFYIDIMFVGYKKNRLNDVLVVPAKKVADLGVVKLEPVSTALNEVVVMGNGNQMEYKIDKKVVNISQNIVASGGTVVDALQNTPSVQTDIEGNVTLRGSSNYTVLIDGKPSVVQGSEALQQIPAAMVQNVEIITNPSAKYDAEGSAGIINVIMKKQKVKGFNGSITVTAGTNRKNNDNIILNYRYDKLNFSLGADYADMQFKMQNGGHNISFDKDVILKDQYVDASGQFHRKGKGLRAGVDYYINDKNTISFSGRIGDRNMVRPFNSYYTDIFPSQNNTIYYLSNNTGQSQDKYYELNMDYTLNLNTKGHQLSASVNYDNGSEDDISDMLQDTTDNMWNPIKGRYTQHTSQLGTESDLRIKADYTYPITDKVKFEAGLQSRVEKQGGDYHIYQNDIENESQKDKLDFNHNINAAYFTFSQSMGLFDYQIGLRAENENREIIQKILKSDTVASRIDFFPTIHLSKQLPWGLQVQLSYTRRTNHPSHWNLDPLKRYMDPQNIRVGNPSLQPEFTGSYELNVQKKLNEMSFFSLEGFYRQTNNPIQQIRLREGDVFINTFDNFGKDQSLGVEGMLNIGLTKWWSLNGSASVFNYKLSGKTLDMSTGLYNDVVKSSTNWNLRGNTMVRLKTGTSFQLNYFYNAPSVTAQGTRGEFYSTGIAVRQELLKRKASLTLQLRDFIGDPKMKMTSETSNYSTNGYFKRETKVVTVTFTYRINNYKQQAKRSQEDMNNGNDSGGDMNGGMM